MRRCMWLLQARRGYFGGGGRGDPPGEVTHCLFTALGVVPGAGDAEVKAAFRLRVKQLHPDVNPSARGDPEALRRFARVVEAYEVRATCFRACTNVGGLGRGEAYSSRRDRVHSCRAAAETMASSHSCA